jgi:hypothetical protein
MSTEKSHEKTGEGSRIRKLRTSKLLRFVVELSGGKNN